MQVNLPIRTNGKQNIKDIIIVLLSNQWPLSPTKLYNLVKKQYGLSVTHQAVYKSLKELESNNIVEKKGKEYALNIGWIDSLGKFSAELKKRYENDLRNGSIETTNLVMNSLHEVDKFLFNTIEKIIREDPDKNKILCSRWCHFWIPLFLDKEVYAKIKEVGSMIQYYSVTSGNTAVDKWCYNFWKKTPVKVKINAYPPESFDVGVYKDIVIEVHYPENLLKELDRIFGSVKDMADLDMDELFESFFMKKRKIPVVINKNPLLAEQIRQKTIALFK